MRQIGPPSARRHGARSAPATVWKSEGMADGGEVGRLAELAIALSLATDLGTGQPLEHGLRTCWLSGRSRP
jgi:hypothetical protein